MLSQSNIFLGVLLLIVAAQVHSFEYIEDVIARARKNAALYDSGKDIGKPVFEAEGMAVDVGDLNNETFPLLPDNVKVAIIACYQLLTKSSNQSPVDILSAMTQSPLLQSDQDASIKRTDIFMSNEKSWWNIFGGKSEATQIRELDNWLLELINNYEFSTAMHLHGDSSINMAKAAMKIFQNLRKSCGQGTVNRDIINLPVLQYPQSKTNVIVERHLKVWAWVDCNDSDKNGGITGEYTKRQFIPRDSVISSLSQKTRDKAIAKIEAIFAEIAPREEKPAGESVNSTNSTVTGNNRGDEDDDDEDEDDVCE